MDLETLVLPLKTEDNAFRAGISRVTQLVGGLVDFLGDCVTEASASEDALAQLDAVLKSTGGAAGVTAEMANELASAFQATTKFSDEAVLSAESMLLTFTSVGKDVFPLATQTILDMSQALGQDLKSSAIQLGKALNDPQKGITALQRVGVQFNEEQRKMIDNMIESGDLMGAQTMILQELQKEFGGSAEAAGQTFGGQLAILKNRLSDVKETIGKAVLPVLSSLAGTFMKVFDTPAFQNFMNVVLKGFESIGKWITDVGLPGFIKFGEELKKVFDKGGLRGVMKWLDDFVGNVIQGMADGVDNWVTGGGPQELSDKIISWVENIGTGGEFESKALTAATNLVTGLANALLQIDWVGITDSIDAKLAEAINAHDWTSSGESFGAALDSILLNGTNMGLETAESQAVPAIVSALGDWFTGAIGQQNLNNWVMLGNAMIARLREGVLQGYGQANPVIAAVSAVSGQGWAVAAGQGIGAGLPSIWAKLTEMATSLENRLTDIAKVFYNRGLGWANQAAQGFLGGMNTILGAVSTLVGEINAILKKIITSFTLSFKIGNIGDSSSTGGGSVGGRPGTGGGGCFVAGTLVTLGDGMQAPIEQIRVGDTVRSWHNGEFINAVVVETFHHAPADAPVLVRLNGVLVGTPEHLIYVNGDWLPLGFLKVGDSILINGKPAKVETMERRYGFVPVYNLETNHESHNYLANNILVHNGKTQQNAAGGSFMIPSSAGWENFNLGALGTASGGEAVRITPRGQAETVELGERTISRIIEGLGVIIPQEVIKGMNNA